MENRNNLMDFRNWCKNQHDKIGQTYGRNYPYSFHLDAVAGFTEFFWEWSPGHMQVLPRSQENVLAAAYAHDILEDTNNTFNNLEDQLVKFGLDVDVAEIVYRVTDEKGRNRAERKNDKYYKELLERPEAVYVKVCDIAANRMFSRLTNSPMYFMYKEEWPKVRERLAMYEHSMDDIFNYIGQI